MSLIGAIFRIKTICAKIRYKILFGSRFNYTKFSCRSNFRVFIEDTGRIEIGEGCFFNNDCSLNAQKEIKIGKDCAFGEGVKIYDHNHKFRDSEVRIANQGFSVDPVIIGDNCWIGSNVTIVKGAKIGNHVVIGAGCVIDREIKDNSIVTSGARDLKIKEMEK
ncbi:MAG: acyltransferase [Clostridia bacterium]|nr:acyltransferase [Clostridia bacterium]